MCLGFPKAKCMVGWPLSCSQPERVSPSKGKIPGPQRLIECHGLLMCPSRLLLLSRVKKWHLNMGSLPS